MLNGPFENANNDFLASVQSPRNHFYPYPETSGYPGSYSDTLAAEMGPFFAENAGLQIGDMGAWPSENGNTDFSASVQSPQNHILPYQGTSGCPGSYFDPSMAQMERSFAETRSWLPEELKDCPMCFEPGAIDGSGDCDGDFGMAGVGTEANQSALVPQYYLSGNGFQNLQLHPGGSPVDLSNDSSMSESSGPVLTPDRSQSDGELMHQHIASSDETLQQSCPRRNTEPGTSTEGGRTYEETKDGRSKCIQCNRVFKNRSDFFRHRQDVHLRLRGGPCPNRCGAVFSRRDNIRRHVKTCGSSQ